MAALRTFLVPVDLVKNELRNARIQNLASAPSSPVEGQAYYDTTLHQFGVYNGTTWVYLGSGGGTVTSVGITDSSGLFSVSGSPVTTSGDIEFTFNAQTSGTVLASVGGLPAFVALDHTYISDFDAQVRTSRLDQMAAPTADVSLNSHKLTNVTDPTSAQDAATKNYVDSVAQGLDPKPGARAATAAALPACTYANGTSGVGATLTGNSNGALTVDGYAVAAGDIILVKNQATGAQNGLYDVTQAGSGGTPFILTRNASMDTTGEFQSAYIVVEDAGTTNANSFWVCTNSANPTVGTTAITFSQLNGATQLTAGTGISIVGNTISTTAVRKYSALIGDGVSTSIAVTQGTHGLAANGQMLAAVYDASSGDEIVCGISINNSNGTVTFAFVTAPATNAYRIVIMG